MTQFVQGRHHVSLWGTSEAAYSRAVAQCLALSSEFRGRFLKTLAEAFASQGRDHVGTLFCHSELVGIATEVPLDSSDRIDIVVEFTDGSRILIENKTWAGLQPDQLLRYYRHVTDRDVLVLLAPASYSINDHDRPSGERFIQLSYRALHDICGDISRTKVSTNGGFESGFFHAIATLFMDVEQMPLTTNECDALRRVASLRIAEQKIRAAVKLIRNLKSIDAAWNWNYVLGKRVVGDLELYAGVRFDTDWAFSEPLTGSMPEAIAYLKDTEPDKKKALDLHGFLEQSYRRTSWNRLNATAVILYPRTQCGKPRLAVGRPLDDSALYEREDLAAWFNAALDWLEDVTKDWVDSVTPNSRDVSPIDAT